MYNKIISPYASLKELLSSKAFSSAFSARSLFSFTLKKMSNYGTVIAAKATSANLAHAIVEGGIDMSGLLAAADADYHASNAGQLLGVADTAIVAVEQAVTIDIALDKDSNAIAF